MVQAADGSGAMEGGAEAAALQAHLDSAIQAGLIQTSGLSSSGEPGASPRDGSQSAGAKYPLHHILLQLTPQQLHNCMSDSILENGVILSTTVMMTICCHDAVL